jgi:hypothetical protein
LIRQKHSCLVKIADRRLLYVMPGNLNDATHDS